MKRCITTEGAFFSENLHILKESYVPNDYYGSSECLTE